MAKHFFLPAFFLQVIICAAQVPVSQEPRHRNAFENEYVRVLDVHLPPGDTSLVHKHETPSVFVMIRNVRTGSQVITQEAPATALARDPGISFEGFYTKPRIHRVWNRDTVEFHVMDIEVLKKNNFKPIAPITQNGFELLFDEKPVCAYSLIVNAETNVRLQRETPILIIGLTNAFNQVMVNEMAFKKKSDFLFIPAGKAISFNNKEAQPFSFVVLELK